MSAGICPIFRNLLRLCSSCHRLNLHPTSCRQCYNGSLRNHARPAALRKAQQHVGNDCWMCFGRPVWAFSGVMALILAVTATYLYQEGFLFDRDSTVVTRGSQEVRVATSPVVTRRTVSGRGEVTSPLPGGVTSTSVRPMQQHYILKQVSYTDTSTRGGL